MSRAAVLVTCPQMQGCLETFRPRFDQHGVTLIVPPVDQQLSEDELLEVIEDCDGMISGDEQLPERVLERARRLKIITKWGVGTDGIDLEAASRLGIRVTNTPSVFGSEVADVALGYVVMLARQLHRIDTAVRAGDWPKIGGRSLAGDTLGVVGFGDIGSSVARRALAFEMQVCAQDVDATAEAAAEENGVATVPLEELLAGSSYVVLCCPLTVDTRHLLNEASFARMRQGAFVINVARGALISEPALVGALESGRVSGAALDVFEQEPLPLGSRLRRFDQCVFGSHNGSNTREAVLRASRLAVEQVLTGLEK